VPRPGAGLLLGPAVGAGLFVLLAGCAPRLPRRRPGVIAARSAYLAAAACFEELLWRGVALAVLAAWLGPAVALVLTSLAFALSHRRTLGLRSAVHVVTGLGFGAAFLGGGLAAAALAHALYNVLVDLSVQAVSRGGSA
jgi:hypothetical protein